MEIALNWWNSLSVELKRKLAEEHHWTTIKQITNEQIEMIYNYKFKH